MVSLDPAACWHCCFFFFKGSALRRAGSTAKVKLHFSIRKTNSMFCIPLRHCLRGVLPGSCRGPPPPTHSSQASFTNILLKSYV